VKKIRMVIALVGLCALAAVPAAAQAAPTAAKQWNVNNTNQVSYGTEYELYNKSTQIGYEKRTFGVDLGWVGHSGGYFEFLRKAPSGTRDHRTGPIGGTEDVAIYNTKTRRYLIYDKRGDTEAELGWSNTPVYEWQIQDQSASGGRVHFALFNDRVDKYLISQTKNYGINLGWLNNTPPAPPTTQSFSLALSPQQITQGWVPYLGRFPILGTANGNLLTVQNASQRATLMFVKPDKRTIDCSDPNATVRVAPSGLMTTDQMKTLYGSATPRLPITFLACLATQTSQSIGLTYVNITYKLDP
jgi:hypothetical protein